MLYKQQNKNKNKSFVLLAVEKMVRNAFMISELGVYVPFWSIPQRISLRLLNDFLSQLNLSDSLAVFVGFIQKADFF